MIRKQLYIQPEQQRKLRTLAACWNCTEAAAVRRAIDRLQERMSKLDAILLREGLLESPSDDCDLPSSEEVRALERELAARLRKRSVPLDLTRTVLEDRR